jgi:large subunit ribosomal protein L7Ae
LFSKNPRSFGIGRSVRPTTDLSRFVKWPRYVRIQRQRAILKKRLKVPPALNQFTRAVDKNQASTLFRLLAHYRPESQEDKTKRLKAKAEANTKGKAAAADVAKTEKPLFVKYGLNHVTQLVSLTERTSLMERNFASSVLICLCVCFVLFCLFPRLRPRRRSWS